MGPASSSLIANRSSVPHWPPWERGGTKRCWENDQDRAPGFYRIRNVAPAGAICCDSQTAARNQYRLKVSRQHQAVG